MDNLGSNILCKNQRNCEVWLFGPSPPLQDLGIRNHRILLEQEQDRELKPHCSKWRPREWRDKSASNKWVRQHHQEWAFPPTPGSHKVYHKVICLGPTLRTRSGIQTALLLPNPLHSLKSICRGSQLSTAFQFSFHIILITIRDWANAFFTSVSPTPSA